MRSQRVAVRIAIIAGVLVTTASATELMPAEEQNALVQKYCTVCHTDSSKNGGLSLEHFDAAHASPSLIAMMLSKLSGGASLQTVREMTTSANAAALLKKKMKSGAMGAAGIPIPSNATSDAWLEAFAKESAGATEWSVERSRSVTASMLREMASSKTPGDAEAYRVVASCNPETREGSIQVAWSPAPQSGSLAASVDGKAAVQYVVDGSEKMGNGSGLELHGRAVLVLAALPFPTESLTIRDLFPDHNVTFSFADLPRDARRGLDACFANRKVQAP
jgi:cytochrome c551/c552